MSRIRGRLKTAKALERLMKRFFTSIMLCTTLFALCSSVVAQQSAKIPRIGYLSRRSVPTSATADPNAEAFRKGLRDLGYIEGKTILLEFRYAAGSLDRLQ